MRAHTLSSDLAPAVGAGDVAPAMVMGRGMRASTLHFLAWLSTCTLNVLLWSHSRSLPRGAEYGSHVYVRE